MRAAVHTGYGPPEVVRVLEIDRPTPGDHEVLIKVHVATVNRTDCGFRAGTPFLVRILSGLTKPRVRIWGAEFAGVVEAVGGGVTTFGVGDDVFGIHEWRFGAHAEYLVMPEDGAMVTKPTNLTYEQVAPSTEGSGYALSMIESAKIRSGQQVLVDGRDRTGGIGSAAVQLVKHLGANVTAVCGTEHIELVRGLGADRVIDYHAEDFTKDHETYDVVIDAVGKSSFSRCKPILKPRGIYVSSELGPYALNPILGVVTPLLGGKKVLFPIPPRHDQRRVGRFKEWIELGAFTPVIDRRYDLDDIVEAYRYVEAGQKIGNVLITVG